MTRTGPGAPTAEPAVQEGDHYPVVIVGAGPTGMTAALLLASYGISCLVLDRWNGLYPQPRAVHLDDEVYRILAHVGLAEKFDAISRPGLGLRLCDRDLRTLIEFERDPHHRPNGYAKANMFDQPDLERLMRSSIEQSDNVHMRGGCEVVDVHNVDNGVRISYTDTSDGSRRWVTADFALGCDGANSAVRRSIGSTMQDLGFAQRWLVVDIATTTDLHQWDGVHQVCDSVRAATYMRIGPTRYRWEFQLHDGENLEDFEDLTAVRPLIDPWLRSAPDADLTLIRSAEYTFRAQVADRWRDRRVLLLGDAAHLTPPFIGQGMGAGLRDAHNLIWKMVGVITGCLPDTALDTYQTERKAHATALIRLAVAMGRAMTGGHRVAAALRQHLAPVLGNLPGIGSKVADSSTPPLVRSAFVLRSPLARRGLSGSLCPNVVLDSGRTLDNSARGRFLLISSTPLTDGQRREVVRRGACPIEVPASSDLGNWLSRGHAIAAIVRPDRTVMATSRSVPSLYTRIPTISISPQDSSASSTEGWTRPTRIRERSTHR